jgi:hypothetical protein
MTKHSVRFLRVLALVLVTFSFISSTQAATQAFAPVDDPALLAAGDCVRDTTWKGPNGEALDCYHCAEATYCYPASQ